MQQPFSEAFSSMKIQTKNERLRLQQERFLETPSHFYKSEKWNVIKSKSN